MKMIRPIESIWLRCTYMTRTIKKKKSYFFLQINYYYSTSSVCNTILVNAFQNATFHRSQGSVVYTSGTKSYPEKSCNGGTASSFWWKWIGNIPLQVLEGSAVVCMCTNITFWSKHLEFCRFLLKKVFLHYSIYSKKYTACKLAVFC